MKRPKFFLTSLCCVILLSAASSLFAQQTFKTTSQSVIGFLEYLPKDYASNSNKYPIVIFLHGLGERGANSTNPATLQTTISSVTRHGPPKHVKNGTQFPFILISPQLKNNYGSWPSWYVMEVLEYVKTYLRIDEKRIHITGLSLGGGGTWVTIQDNPKVFASAAPICGSNNSLSKACIIAAENLPVWAFHGDKDTTVPLGRTVNMVNAINACAPTPSPKAKVTIYPGVNHNSWDRAYDLGHTYHNPNLYEWMMSFTNKKNGSNMIPTSTAGSDMSLSSASKVTVNGSGSDTDGSVTAYKWTKISGPSATLANATTKSLTASGLAAGAYVFKLQVTDDKGSTDSDYVKVAIGSTSGSTTANSAPVAAAGSDRTITLPTNSISLAGNATDSDGTIASYVWSKVSGGAATLSGATSKTLNVSGMVAGTYVFRLTVKDNGGATDTDDVSVIVKSATTTNKVPVANAGSDRLMKMPVSYMLLAGSGNDSDGSIVSYKWAQISGPIVSFSSTTTGKPTIRNLKSGVCVFRLTVKDNKGATDYDDVKITFSYTPVSNAGVDLTKSGITSLNMVGSGKDSDGSISKYYWKKTSGPGITVSNTSSPTLSLSKLVKGTYYFRLTVTDNTGLTDLDDVKLVVN